MNNAIKITKANLNLNIPRPMWLMLFMAAVLCAPNYPRIVGALFIVSLLSSVLGFMRENRSQDFFETLPVTAKDIVMGRMFTIMAIELIYMLAMVLFDVIACFAAFDGGTIATTAVGLKATVAFFGVVFVVYGTYNLTFMSLYEGKGRTPTSLALGIILGLLASVVPYGIIEALVQTVSAVGEALNTFSLSTLWIQAIVLAAGIGIYIGLSLLAVNIVTSKKKQR